MLNTLPLAIERKDELSSFLALDPNYNGVGMASYSRLDKELFDKLMIWHFGFLNKCRYLNLVPIVRSTLSFYTLLLPPHCFMIWCLFHAIPRTLKILKG